VAAAAIWVVVVAEVAVTLPEPVAAAAAQVMPEPELLVQPLLTTTIAGTVRLKSPTNTDWQYNCQYKQCKPLIQKSGFLR
jgi:hypothetical protein